MRIYPTVLLCGCQLNETRVAELSHVCWALYATQMNKISVRYYCGIAKIRDSDVTSYFNGGPSGRRPLVPPCRNSSEQSCGPSAWLKKKKTYFVFFLQRSFLAASSAGGGKARDRSRNPRAYRGPRSSFGERDPATSRDIALLCDERGFLPHPIRSRNERQLVRRHVSTTHPPSFSHQDVNCRQHFCSAFHVRFVRRSIITYPMRSVWPDPSDNRSLKPDHRDDNSPLGLTRVDFC